MDYNNYYHNTAEKRVCGGGGRFWEDFHDSSMSHTYSQGQVAVFGLFYSNQFAAIESIDILIPQATIILCRLYIIFPANPASEKHTTFAPRVFFN